MACVFAALMSKILTMFVIDDILKSFIRDGNSWNRVREALAGIVDLTIQYGSKGLDLHFMHQHQFAKIYMRVWVFVTRSYFFSLRSRFEVQKLSDQLSPTGKDTPMGARLIDMYLPLIEHPSSTHEPISVIVITDGAATDGDDLLRSTIEAASRLDRQQVPLERFGIQFVRIGTDQDAARALQVLDDELSDRYKIRMTSSTPLRPC
ncbi:hypothetical protein EDB19DRAFT_1834776 [Suillus lakei]|nr:hypothetical protein EDB19DRAFT_1834776 [Suillus lakei]